MEQYLTPMGPSKLNVNPIFEIGPLEPRFSEWLVFEVRPDQALGFQRKLPSVWNVLSSSPPIVSVHHLPQIPR